MNYRRKRNYGNCGIYMLYWNSRTVGTMGTMENGEKMKMGSRNLRTQQTWLLNVIIKFGSLMSFHENVDEK